MAISLTAASTIPVYLQSLREMFHLVKQTLRFMKVSWSWVIPRYSRGDAWPSCSPNQAKECAIMSVHLPRPCDILGYSFHTRPLFAEDCGKAKETRQGRSCYFLSMSMSGKMFTGSRHNLSQRGSFSPMRTVVLELSSPPSLL